jgi:hypothetical protein
VHIPQARLGGNDNWQLLLDNTGQPYFFSLAAVGVFGWPAASVRFTRPSSDAKLKTVGICFQDRGSCSYKIWYSGASADGSPNESTLQLLFSGISSSDIRTDYRFTNFKLTNSISVASDFHIILELISGYYGALTYDTGGSPTERSWFRYTYYTGAYTWYKTKDYFAIYPEIYPAGFDPNLMIKVIYETTPQSAPSAPTLSSPANGETVNSQDVTFRWNSVSGADRYFLEVNSSSSWAEGTRVYFATVYGTSQSASGFPVGANYWRVYAGNADAWSTASETRSFTETVPPATLACSVTSLSASASSSQSSFNQSFEVYNSGSGTLNYTITDDASWLSVSPTNGSSTGESDTIQVTYNPCGLSAGTYNANITVSASGASGSPKTIAVTLTVLNTTSLAGDIDGDRLADLITVAGSSWYVWFSSAQYLARGGPYNLGVSGTPVTGDVDGDRLADLIIVSGSSWYVWFSSAQYLARGGPYNLGVSGTPVTGDIDGDQLADLISVVDASWYVWFSSAQYLVRGGPYVFSVSGTPVTGDVDGDGLADIISVSGASWYVWFSSAQYLARGGPYVLNAP